ncbi:uncharacterized protein VTP21DRAFT_3155 [Calcarisporiella thermophila]|uniref:uncharacterized protein n=1 Tax=Calcarisporiella thermophila TaxID=911321 RepID=UPI0037444B7B
MRSPPQNSLARPVSKSCARLHARISLCCQTLDRVRKPWLRAGMPATAPGRAGVFGASSKGETGEDAGARTPCQSIACFVFSEAAVTFLLAPLVSTYQRSRPNLLSPSPLSQAPAHRTQTTALTFWRRRAGIEPAAYCARACIDSVLFSHGRELLLLLLLLASSSPISRQFIYPPRNPIAARYTFLCYPGWGDEGGGLGATT